MKSFGQHPNVIKIFHAAVGEPQRDHRLEFLGDDRLRRVSAQFRRRQVEEGRIVYRFKSWLDGISETDVDDDGDTRPGKRGRAPQAEAALFQPFANRFGTPGAEIKIDAVGVGVGVGVGARLSKTQQIQVAGAARRVRQPSRQEHRPFEGETIRVWGEAQSIKKPLVDELGQQNIERSAGVAGAIQQTSPYRRRDV